MEWIESKGIEREILLGVGNKKRTISDIVNCTKKSYQSIGKEIARMEEKNLINREKDYTKDARKSMISVNFNMVRIKKFNDFYINYYVLGFFSLIFAMILTWIYKNAGLIFGALIPTGISFIYMFYHTLTDSDRVTVEKLKKEDSEI